MIDVKMPRTFSPHQCGTVVGLVLFKDLHLQGFSYSV